LTTVALFVELAAPTVPTVFSASFALQRMR
jgi:hypothetical protein